MKNWKTYRIVLFVIFCIFLNGGGRLFAKSCNLMLWLDSFGTVLCAYAGGPVCGAIVGGASNIIYGMVNHSSYIYAFTNIMIGLVVGYGAKKKAFETLFGTMSISAVIALASVAVSVPLNVMINDGSTGNIWGDGVAHFIMERGCPWVVADTIGQFYVDFLDKFLTLLILYVALKVYRSIKNRISGKKENVITDDYGQVFKALPLFLVLALSAVPQNTYAEDAAENETAVEDLIDYNDYVQTVFSSNNGLPCGEANDIEETTDGILWIGTYAGLYRYNGREFRWMDNFESVHNVNCLYVDDEGRLWIGTNDNGLSIAINEKVVNVIDEAKGLPSNSVRSIIQGADGYYYVGTTSSMQVVALRNGLRKVNTFTEVNYADKITADRIGNVAAVTSDGRLFLIKGGQILCSLQLGENEIFTCCTFDPDGYLMAGTSGSHIYVYDVSAGRFKKKKAMYCRDLASLNDLYFLDNGTMFIAADNGIGYLDSEGFPHTVNVNEFNNSIDNALIDYQGNLWFTSSRLGLLRMAQSAFRDVYSTIGMESRVVNTVEKWQGNFYIGTDAGLDIVDSSCRESVENELTEQLKGTRIRCIISDSHGSLWICTYGGGLIEVEQDGTQHLYNSDNGSFGNRARTALELSDGTIVAAGDTGLSFISDHKVTRTIGYMEGLINSMILTITELPDGRILAGTDGDGIAIIKDGEVVDMLMREDGLTSGVILRSIKDPKSDGVFLVTSNGLCYMEEDFSIRPIKNFPYFNNYDIWVKNKETLFVTSSAGIYVVSRDDLVADKENMTYDLLDARRGLNSALTANSWNYADDEGDLFLSCDKGMFIIDTDRYAISTRSYRMNLTSVSLDNNMRRIERGNVIRVGRGVRKMELFPEIINYTIQDPNAGYYLEGIDSDWYIMPQRNLSSITYTNIPSGDYTLHLAVFDSNKENILEERTFRVIKEKEIYDESWFIFYVVGVAMLFVAWIPWYFTQRALNRAEARIRMSNETMMAIANTVDAKDTSTSQHSYRVSIYAVQIAQRMGFSKKECENLRHAARMHDIGKIGIPDSVLNKPGRLTDDEYAIMKSHVVQGSNILKGFTLIDHVVEGARYHHERYDGKGYPDGLKGEEIPLYGRIIGVADAFDAMTANRVYRKKLDLDYVLGEMKRCKGTQFDPKCVDILLELIEEGTIDVKAMYPELKEQEEEADKKQEGES